MVVIGLLMQGVDVTPLQLGAMEGGGHEQILTTQPSVDLVQL